MLGAALESFEAGNLKSFPVLSALLACQGSANHKRPPGSARLAGALLLGATDRTTGLVRRFAGCFRDGRDAASIEHSLSTLVGQRLFAIAPGYEDLNDRDELRHDPVMAVLFGKLKARRKSCAPMAGKSTLSPLEAALLPAQRTGLQSRTCRDTPGHECALPQ